MATRSLIGVKNEDGSVVAIYCHWDGYVRDGVGQLLAENYDEAKARALIALGSISVLGESLEPPAGEEHSFEKPYPGVTVAYARDRGEAMEEPFTGTSVSDFLQKIPCFQYVYLLEEGQWMLYLDGGDCKVPLSAVL